MTETDRRFIRCVNFVVEYGELRDFTFPHTAGMNGSTLVLDGEISVFGVPRYVRALRFPGGTWHISTTHVDGLSCFIGPLTDALREHYTLSRIGRIFAEAFLSDACSTETVEEFAPGVGELCDLGVGFEPVLSVMRRIRAFQRKNPLMVWPVRRVTYTFEDVCDAAPVEHVFAHRAGYTQYFHFRAEGDVSSVSLDEEANTAVTKYDTGWVVTSAHCLGHQECELLIKTVDEAYDAPARAVRLLDHLYHTNVDETNLFMVTRAVDELDGALPALSAYYQLLVEFVRARRALLDDLR
jgi:hypothetical protein